MKSVLDLHLSMNLSHEMNLHEDTYNVKHRHPNTLHKPMLLEPIRQIQEKSCHV